MKHMRRARAGDSEANNQHSRSTILHMVLGTMRVFPGQKSRNILTYIVVITLAAAMAGERSPSLRSGDTVTFEQQTGNIALAMATIQPSQLSTGTKVTLLSKKGAAAVASEVCCSSLHQTSFAAHASPQVPTCSIKFLRKGSTTLSLLCDPATNKLRCIIQQLQPKPGTMLNVLQVVTALSTLCMRILWLFLMMAVLCASFRPATLYGRRNQYYTHATRPIGASICCSVVICRRAWRHKSLWTWTPPTLDIWRSYQPMTRDCSTLCTVYCISQLCTRVLTGVCQHITSRTWQSNTIAFHPRCLRQRIFIMIIMTVAGWQVGRTPGKLAFIALNSLPCLALTNVIAKIVMVLLPSMLNTMIQVLNTIIQNLRRSSAPQFRTQPDPYIPSNTPRVGGGHDSINSELALTTSQATLVLPEAVGLYCEVQRDGHCGAHALNAMFGRSVIKTNTKYLHNMLEESLSHLPSLVHELQLDLTLHYNTSGWYSCQALNHWLYEYADGDAALFAVALVGDEPNDEIPSCTKRDILARAPAGCKSLLMLHKNRHYTAWVCSNVDNNWYECDSIVYATTSKIRLLTEHDWETFRGAVYTSVEVNAYTAAISIVKPHQHIDISPGIDGTHELLWIDPHTLNISTRPLRSVVQTHIDTALQVKPDWVNLYCDKQQGRQCGAHALNAIFGRAISDPPYYLHPHLASSAAAAWGPTSYGQTGYRFQPDGNYSIAALCHYIYEHTYDDVAIMNIANINQYGRMSKAEILNKAPQNCTTLLLHFEYQGNVPHYKVWKQGDNKIWYELDSIEYTNNREYIKKLEDEDWASFHGSIYCLKQADALRKGLTLIEPARGTYQSITNDHMLPWVDGDSLEVFREKVRLIQANGRSCIAASATSSTTTSPHAQETRQRNMQSRQVPEDKPMMDVTRPPSDSDKRLNTKPQSGPNPKDIVQPPIRQHPYRRPAPSRKFTKRQSKVKAQKEDGMRDIRQFFTHTTTRTTPSETTFNVTKQSATEGTSTDLHAPKHTHQPKNCLQTSDNVDNISTASSLKITTCNVRGIHNALLDIQQLLQDKPHIVVLTELKSKRKLRKLDKLLSEYHVFYSLCIEGRRAQAGVAVAIGKSISELGTIKQHPISDCMQGYMLHVTLELPESKPLHILGTYCPHTVIIRRRVYWLAQKMLDKLTDTFIMVGDFNATLQDGDRVSNTSSRADTLHRTFVTSTGLSPIELLPSDGSARKFTYRKGMSNTPYSRIDDILINQNALKVRKLSADTHTTDMTGSTTDHDALTSCIPFQNLHLLPPLPPALAGMRANTRFKRLTMEDKSKLASALEEQLGLSWSHLETKTHTIVQADAQPHWQALASLAADEVHTCMTLGDRPAREVVDELGEQITNLLAQSRDVALKVMPVIPTNVEGLHFRPRTISRRWKRLKTWKKQLSHLISSIQTSESKTCSKESSPDQHTDPALQDLIAECGEQLPHTDEATRLKATYKHVTRMQAQIHRDHTKLSEQMHMKEQQKLLDKHQKLGNQMATGKHKSTPSVACRAILTDGRLMIDPKEVIDQITAWGRQKTVAPEPNGKQGKYLPKDTERRYPFDHMMDPEFDRYKGLMDRTKPTQARAWLHHIISDEHAFAMCLKSLKAGKAPGPDGVINEILQALPPAGKTALHNAMKIFWATGLTPSNWKCSDTILIYKHKGTPPELQYYRRIGLENTVYKLWTRLVTVALVDTAERQGMLSNSQAGFRHRRSTTHQAEMMVMALEDAYLTKQDIYLLMADMSEAFDTISHDKLLMIMYDLGFPTDAIEVIKDLYTNASTIIRTPHGPTPPIPVNRGTIQGDSLSPFLFVIYIEPLLRWLQADGRGYKLGVLQAKGPSMQAQYQISNITFADDINVATGGKHGLRDMKHQTRKLDAYLPWANLTANNSKTLVMGALHGTFPHKPYDDYLMQQQLSVLRLQGQTLTYHPARKPFRHLGILLTMDLNYKPLLKHTIEETRNRVKSLKQSYASTGQKMRILNTCIKPSITYAFTIAPFTRAELKVVDNILSTAYKHAYNLPTAMSTACLREDIDNGGVGCPSLEVEYDTICIQRLTRALNDPGPLGVTSRALLEYQKQSIDALTADALPHMVNYCMRLRQMLALHRNGLTLIKEQQIQDNLKDMHELAKSLSDIIRPEDSWDVQLVQDLHSLHNIGVVNIEHMLTPDRKSVRPVQDLDMIARRRLIKLKHKKAWNRISHYLTQGCPHNQPETLTTANIPYQNRKVHPQVMAALAERYPSNPTARGRTILHYISNVYTCNTANLQKARDTLADYQAKLARNQVTKTAETRTTDAAATMQVEVTTDTGYAKYLKLMSGKGQALQRHTNQLLALYTMYAHTPEVIEHVKALITVTMWCDCHTT